MRVISRLLLLSLCLPFLFACSRTVFNANGTGFGGTDDDYLTLELSRREVLAALRSYRNGERRELWGDLAFRGESPTVSAFLVELADRTDKAQYIRDWLGVTTNVTNLIQALEAISFSLTNDPAILTIGGVIQQAVTRGTHVYFNRTESRNLRREDRFTDWIHEALHSLGYPDGGSAGPFVLTREFLSSLGAGGAAYNNGLAGRQNSGSPNQSQTLFFDPFTTSEWQDRWIVESGEGNIVGGRLSIPQASGSIFLVELRDIRLKDFSASIHVDLTDPALPWAHVGGRRTVEGFGYSAAVGSSNMPAGIVQVSVSRRDATGWSILCSRQFSTVQGLPAKGRLTLSARGNQISANFRGEPVCSTTDNNYPEAGAFFLRTSTNLSMDNFFVRP